MFVRQVLFDLNDASVDREALREYLRSEAVDAFGAVPGLRLKVWIADDQANTWGAIYLWESRKACAAAGPLPSRAAELIGHGPVVTDYDVEATVEGAFTSSTLGRVGRAFES
jgi:putative monooxygenase ydhR